MALWRGEAEEFSTAEARQEQWEHFSLWGIRADSSNIVCSLERNTPKCQEGAKGRVLSRGQLRFRRLQAGNPGPCRGVNFCLVRWFGGPLHQVAWPIFRFSGIQSPWSLVGELYKLSHPVVSFFHIRPDCTETSELYGKSMSGEWSRKGVWADWKQQKQIASDVAASYKQICCKCIFGFWWWLLAVRITSGIMEGLNIMAGMVWMYRSWGVSTTRVKIKTFHWLRPFFRKLWEKESRREVWCSDFSAHNILWGSG